MNTAIKDYRRFQVQHFFRYLGDALFYAFLTIYFNSLNFDSWKLGTLLAIIPLTAILGSFVIGKLSGKAKRNILLLKIINIIEALVMVFFGFVTSFPLLLIITIVISFCNKSFYSLLDAAAMDSSIAANKNYSSVRIFGSLAYLISSFAGGYLIDWLNFKFVFMIAGALFLISGIFVLFIKPNEKAESEKTAKDKDVIKTIFRTPNFIFYLLFYVFALGASNVTDNIYALYVTSLGMSQSNYGLVNGMSIAFEIIAMFVVIKFIKTKYYKKMLLISAIIIFARDAVLAIPLPLIVVAFIPILRGISWGIMLAVHLNTLKTLINSKYLTKSIFVLGILLQIFNAIFNQFGPTISEYSYPLMFSLMAGSALIGASFMAVIAFRKENKKELSSFSDL